MSAQKAVRAYRYGRAALASAIGIAFLVAGLFQSAGGSGRSSDVLWFILIFALAQLGAHRLYRRTRDMADEERFQTIAARREAQRAEADDGKKIVGRICVHCDQRIVVEHDGSRCKECRKPVHDDCLKGHTRDGHANRDGAYR